MHPCEPRCNGLHNIAIDYYRVATRYPFKMLGLFTDFSLTFDRFPDPFGRPILSILSLIDSSKIFIQIVMLADLILKEKSQTINIRKGMFLNINC